MMDIVVPRAFTASVLQPDPVCAVSTSEDTILPGAGLGSLERQSSAGRPMWIQAEQAAGKLGAGGQNWGAGTAEGCVAF